MSGAQSRLFGFATTRFATPSGPRAIRSDGRAARRYRSTFQDSSTLLGYPADGGRARTLRLNPYSRGGKAPAARRPPPPPNGMPRRSPLASPCGSVTEPTPLALVAADSSTAPGEPPQFAGTDSPPILVDEAKFADTAPVVWPPTLPRPPRCRPANCGVAYQEPPAPAVAPPGPVATCCNIEMGLAAKPKSK